MSRRLLQNLSHNIYIYIYITIIIFNISLSIFLPSPTFADHGNSIAKTSTVSISDNLSITDLIPTQTGGIAITDIDISVTTAATHGYTLTVAGANGDNTNNDHTSLYKDGDLSSANKIKSIIGTNVPLGDNTWGYSVDSTTYSSLTGNVYYGGGQDDKLFSGISTTPQTIRTYASSATNSTTPIYIGVKAVSPLAIGTYMNSLTFTSTVEPDYEDTGAIAVSPASSNIGSTITITTDYSNSATAVNNSRVAVKIFTGSPTDYITGLGVGSTSGGMTIVATCTSVSINSTNNGTSVSKPLTITCSVPTSYASPLTNGDAYGVAIEVQDATSGQVFSYWKDSIYTINTEYSYSVSYYSNAGSDTVTSMPTNQNGSADLGSNITIDIPSTTPKRTGYKFLGWATSSTATSPDSTYNPGNSFTLTQGSSTKDLHAVWKQLPPVLGNMQSTSTVTACLNLSDGTMGIATDNRDGKQYFVQKLADGKCWMMQDLDLDLYVLNSDGTVKSGVTASTGSTGYIGTKNGDSYVLLTSSNTNISSSSKWSVYGSSRAFRTQKASAGEVNGTYYWHQYGCGGSDSWASGAGYLSTDATYCGTSSSPIYEVRSYDGDNNYCMKPYASTTPDNTGNGENGSSSVVVCGTAGSGTEANEIGEANTQRIGNYYNWPTATAGSGTYAKPTTKNTIVTESICPKGWHLPYGGTNSTTTGTSNSAPGGFGYMFKKEGVVSSTTAGTTMTNWIMTYVTGYAATPTGKHYLTFLRSGLYNTYGAISVRGTNGYYWSSAASASDSSKYAYSFDFYESSMQAGMSLNRYKGHGLNVRCVSD